MILMNNNAIEISFLNIKKKKYNVQALLFLFTVDIFFNKITKFIRYFCWNYKIFFSLYI